jgi:hypothetical protein
MSGSKKNRSIIPDNSPIVLTFTLGLLLLSLFIALSANRVPNSVKKTKALRSIAANFRKTTNSKIDQNKLKDKVTTDLSHPGMVKLTGLINNFFAPDATLLPVVQEGVTDLARQVKDSNAALEIYCQSAASGVSLETAYQKLTEAEARCERVANIFRQEGVPNFNIASRAGFRLTSDDNIQFVIRGETFRSSWD